MPVRIVAPPAAQPLPQPSAPVVQYAQPALAPAPVRYAQPQYVYVQPAPQYVQPAQQPVVQYVQPAPQYVQPVQQPAVQYVQPAPQYVQPVSPYTQTPNGWPAPPPGYAYVPITQLSPGVQAQRNELYDELHRTETRLGELEGQSLRLGAPITFMVLGYGTMLLSSVVALSSFSAAEDIQHHRWNHRGSDLEYDTNYDGKVNKRDEHEFRQRAYGFTALAGLGLVVGTISTFRLVSKIHTRRELRSERASLTEKRKRLRSELDYGVGATPQSMQFTLQGRY